MTQDSLKLVINKELAVWRIDLSVYQDDRLAPITYSKAQGQIVKEDGSTVAFNFVVPLFIDDIDRFSNLVVSKGKIATGGNCYSFACGKAPHTQQKAVPGAKKVNDIRCLMLTKLREMKCIDDPSALAKQLVDMSKPLQQVIVKVHTPPRDQYIEAINKQKYANSLDMDFINNCILRAVVNKMSADELNETFFSACKEFFNQSIEIKKKDDESNKQGIKKNKRKRITDIFTKAFSIYNSGIHLTALKVFMEELGSRELINSFTQIFYDRNVDQLDLKQLTEFIEMLDDYEVNKKYINPVIVYNLLIWDGLIPLLPNKDYSEIDISMDGSFLVAAFLEKCAIQQGDYDPYIDYHFLRLFQDGWYECLSPDIKKRNCSLNPSMLTLDPTEVRNGFGKDNFDFIGYFLVPSTVRIFDCYCQEFIFESIKSKPNT